MDDVRDVPPVARPSSAAPTHAGRCAHWHGRDDVLLIALPCCNGFWPCRECHDETVDHEAKRWPRGGSGDALMCGRCGAAQGIQAYLAAPDACPSCHGAFNPQCRLHHHLYFEAHE